MNKSVVLLALALFAVALAPLPAAASTSTYILVGDITEDECDNSSPEFVSFITASPHGQFSFSQCINFKYIDPVASQRYFVAPSGQLIFGFVVMLKDNASGRWGPTMDATYTITVTVADTTPGANETASNFATVTLFGSKSTLAPAGAVGSGLQATPGGTAYAFVNIPVNADWAESAVSISVQTSQSAAANGAPWIQSCSTGVNQSGGLVCTYPLQWKDSATVSGTVQNASAPNIALPANLPSDAFALFVTPAAAFQLPVFPVAMLYAPLGDAGTSSYTVSSTSGTSSQIGNTQVSTTSWTSDDKTTYSEGISLNNVLNTSLAFTGTQSWDNSEEMDDQSTYGLTGQILTSDQLSVTYSQPATTTTPLSGIGYATQPFWSDQVIAAINPQFAIWNYPGGDVVQPLGDETVVEIPISALDQCINSPNATQTATPNSTNTSHFVAYPGPVSAGTTSYLWLTSQDCTNLASLDAFYVAKSQSAQLPAYRLLFTGSVPATGFAVNNTRQTQLMAGTTTGSQLTTKITATAQTGWGATLSNSENIGGDTAAAGTDALNSTLGYSQQSTNTNVQTTQVTYSAQSSQTLQSSLQSTTSIKDTSGATVPVNVLQDVVFQGIAVQDTDMHYPEPIGLAPCRWPSIICRLIQNLGTITITATRKTYAWDDPTPMAKRPASYVVEGPFGSTQVSKPSDPASVAKAIAALHAEAANRHFARAVPKPPHGSVVAVVPAQYVARLEAIPNPSPELSQVLAALHARKGPAPATLH